jgi:hypothetical protein
MRYATSQFLTQEAISNAESFHRYTHAQCVIHNIACISVDDRTFLTSLQIKTVCPLLHNFYVLSSTDGHTNSQHAVKFYCDNQQVVFSCYVEFVFALPTGLLRITLSLTSGLYTEFTQDACKSVFFIHLIHFVTSKDSFYFHQ